MKRESARGAKSRTARKSSSRSSGSGKTAKKPAKATAEKPARKAARGAAAKSAKGAAKKGEKGTVEKAAKKPRTPSAQGSPEKRAQKASGKSAQRTRTGATSPKPMAPRPPVPGAAATDEWESPRSSRERGRPPRDRDSSLAAAPARTDLSKPPLKEPIPPSLDGDKFRNILRAPLRDSGLPRRIAHGAVLPALLTEGRDSQLHEQLDWALEDRVPAFYLAESLLQSYLFVGFPRTINALARLHDVTRSRRRGLGLSADPLHVPSEIPSLDRILGGPGDFGSALKGRRIRLAEGPPMHLESPGEGPGSFERYAREWWRRGSELCRAVYGAQYERLRENLGRVHPELADWMVFEGYGKVLSRPVITPRERELWIIPLLLVQRVPEQLYSHLRGAKNLGVPMGRIRAVLWLAAAVAGATAYAEATSMLDEIERRDAEQREDRLRTIL